jgi:hypothetical protein
MTTESMTTESGEKIEAETHLLIESDKVQGTPVYRSNGERVGTVERVMIDKMTGQVAYAVMSFGGVLGIGKDNYPLPWNALRYNSRLGGYELDIDRERLETAPKYGPQDAWDWKNRGKTVNDYWSALS